MSPEKVQLLFKEPSRHYDVIADFQSRNEDAAAIRNKAAKIGADAVIVSYFGGRYSGDEQWANQVNDTGMYTRITGTAIKYK